MSLCINARDITGRLWEMADKTGRGETYFYCTLLTLITYL